jgi:hypothetical protein
VSIDEAGRVTQEAIDVEDRDLWYEANPALVSGRGGGEPFLAEQLLRLGPASFAREHLGVWDPPDDEHGARWSLFDEDAWVKGEVVAKEDWLAGPYTYAIEVARDRSRYVIAAAGLHGDRIGTETGESGPYDEAAVLGRLVELHAKGKGLIIDSKSPACTLLRPLKDLYDIEPMVVTTAERAAADQSYYDAHRADLAHSDQDPELDLSVAAATARPYSGGWLIDRTEASSTVIAHSLARWGHLEIPDPEVVPMVAWV